KDQIEIKLAEFVCKLVEETEPSLVGPKTVEALDLLEAEIGNIRAALGHSKEVEDSETGLRIAAALRRFWITRGFSREGSLWLAQLLALAPRKSDRLTARALTAAGVLANQLGQFRQATEYLSSAYRIYQNLGAKRGIAEALGYLGVLRQCNGCLTESQQMLS